MKKLQILFLMLVCSFCQTSFANDPDTGWWWNADESGRGYSIEKQGDKIFFAAYLYDDSGNPTWFTAVLTRDAADNFIGNLQQFFGGQTLLGEYKAPNVLNENAGQVILSFSDDFTGTLTWPGGTVAITRFIFSLDEVTNTDNDTPGDPAAIARGAETFQANCSDSSCHTPDPANNQNNILSGGDPDSIRSAFSRVQRMIDAGIPTRVSGAEIIDIAAYLNSVKL